MDKKKIVVTGGHLTPALAVIDELIERGGWEIYFFGRKYAAEGEKTPSLESVIIPGKGIWFIPISAGRLQRKFTGYTIPAVLRIPLGFFQSLFHLIRIRPKVILSFGGYVSVPVVMAGWFLGIPSVTHEQTTVIGRATKVNSLFAKKIAVSWPQTMEKLPLSKVVLTGNPIRKEVFKPDNQIWQALDFPKGLPLILITGGNQGSHLINQTVEEILPKLLRLANVFHQCGHLNALGDFERLQEVRRRLPARLVGRYHVKKYLTAEEMGALLNEADLVISRAGANTLTELAVLGKPAILIPLPWLYQDEQTENARMLVKTGIAQILSQSELTAKNLLQTVANMLKDISSYQKNAWRAKKLIKPGAEKRIADLLKETVG